MIETLPGLRSASDTFAWPHVIRLVQYVRVPRAVQRKISRRALFARDGWRCVYCGTSSGRLTLDHVVPRSQGGDSIWENVVTACAPCNLRKGDRIVEESGLHLRGRLRRLFGPLHPHRSADDPSGVAAGSSRFRRPPRRVCSSPARTCGETHAGRGAGHPHGLARADLLPSTREERRRPARGSGTTRRCSARGRGAGTSSAVCSSCRSTVRTATSATAAGSRSAARTSTPWASSGTTTRAWRSGPLRRHARERASSLRVHGGPAGAAAAARRAACSRASSSTRRDHELVRAQRNGISAASRAPARRNRSVAFDRPERVPLAERAGIEACIVASGEDEARAGRRRP